MNTELKIPWRETVYILFLLYVVHLKLMLSWYEKGSCFSLFLWLRNKQIVCILRISMSMLNCRAWQSSYDSQSPRILAIQNNLFYFIFFIFFSPLFLLVYLNVLNVLSVPTSPFFLIVGLYYRWVSRSFPIPSLPLAIFFAAFKTVTCSPFVVAMEISIKSSKTNYTKFPLITNIWCKFHPSLQRLVNHQLKKLGMVLRDCVGPP